MQNSCDPVRIVQATDAYVSVAVVVFVTDYEGLNTYQVQVWQGPWDVSKRCWLAKPTGPRVQSGFIPNNKELAFQFGAQMAADLGCVDLIAKDSN